MPDSKSTTMTPNEVQLLADRLYARGVSKIGVDTAEQASDLRVASRVIRGLLHELDRAASITGDLARVLRELRINVAG